MTLKLRRQNYRPDGIFGVLEVGLGKYWTLEHSYLTETNGVKYYLPKLPPGTYDCVRGQHRLPGMDHDFVTFEVTNVPGHTGILFHWGNYNKDSAGCILLGKDRNMANTWYVGESRTAFSDFMDDTKNETDFSLVVL